MRILIADDHELLRDMFVLYLDADSGFEVETVADFDGALKLAETAPRFDLILLDVAMPGMNGLEGMRRMMRLPGQAPVGLVSGTATPAVAREALSEGAAGFLPKSLSGQAFIEAVRVMARGGIFAPHEFLRSGPPGAGAQLSQDLSRREMQVLFGLSQGRSNKEIARDLEIREPTVKLHLKTLYRKIGASNRIQAAMFAKDAGLF